MSEVESAIDSLLSNLRNLSSSYRSSAANLIQAADQATQALRTPGPGELDYDVDRALPAFVRVPLPPTLPGVKGLTLPTAGDLQAISGINNQFSGTPPDLSWPKFKYKDVEAPGEFTDSAPPIPALSLHPIVPGLAAFTAPDTTTPTPVTVDALSGEPPTVPLPSFTAFVGDLYAEYENGLGALGVDFADWSETLAQLRAALEPLETDLYARLRGILTGTEPGLPDTWETQTYEQAQHEAFAQRYAGLDALDAAPGSITGLPSGQRDYAQLKLEMQTLQTVALAAVKTTNARQQREVQHLQWALDLAVKLADAALELRAQEASWRMQGVLLTLDGAQATLDVALKVLAFKSKEVAMWVRYNDTQVRRTEDRMKLEKTKLEQLQVQVANNKLKATYNQHQADIDAIASAYVETTITLFEAQVDYLLADQDWRKLSFTVFEAEVAAYQARVKATLAEHAALKARIKGDLAQADAELALAKQYEIEMKAQEANARALLVRTKVRAERNQQALTAYNAEVAAKLGWLRGVDRVVDLAVRALVQGYEAEVQEQVLQLASQEIKDQEELAAAQQKMQEEQLDLLTTLQIHSVHLEQAAAQGRVMAQGASTLGGIAQAAYAGLNAVGTRELIEEA